MLNKERTAIAVVINTKAMRFVMAIAVLAACGQSLVSCLNAQEFTSPRADAVGAYIAVSDDVFGLDWNTSAMALSNRRVQMSFSFRRQELTVRNFGLLLSFRDRHVLAIRKTPEFAASITFDKLPVPANPEDIVPYDLLSFFQYEWEWGIGYAFRVNPNLSVGVDAKRYIFSNNLLSSSRFWSFSLSSTYLLNSRWRLGVVFRNLLRNHYRKHNNRLIFRLQGEPDFRIIPVDYDAFKDIVSEPERRIDIGAAFKAMRNIQISMEGYSDWGFAAGLEWEPLSGLFLRQSISRKSDGLFKAQKVALLSTGAGLRYGSARLDLTFLFSNNNIDMASENSTTDTFILSRSNLGKEFQASILFFIK